MQDHAAGHDVDDSSSQEPGDAPMGSGEKAIRELCARAGFRSLTALAKRANIDRLTLRLAAKGQRIPTRPIVERIARALGVSPEIIETAFAEARVHA
jgi:transcriptional regulator with XRE-family HTH domain